jgi:hypothetical protein
VTEHFHSTSARGAERHLSMVVDCSACPARDVRCDDCMVTAMLSQPAADLPLDAAERQAVTRLVSAGLVSPQAAAAARARATPSGGTAAVG